MKRLGSFFDEIYGFDGMSSFLLFISVILNSGYRHVAVAGSK